MSQHFSAINQRLSETSSRVPLGSMRIHRTQKGVILTVIVYYSEKMQIEKVWRAASRTNQTQTFKCPVPVELHECTYFSQQLCFTICANCCQPGKPS